MKVCYFGDFDPEYSRNKVIIKGLQENGIEVIFCNTQGKNILKKIFDLWKKSRKERQKCDITFVGYSDSRFLVLLAKMLGHKNVVWDAFYSLYDSWVFDKKIVGKYALKAFFYWFLDWFNCILSKKILLDTSEHIRYFSETFHISKNKFVRVFVGSIANTTLNDKKNDQTNIFRVFFYGKFIPLQGVEYIIKSAHILENQPDIHFQILGSGQTYEENIELARSLGVKNIEFIPKVNYKELLVYISKADICLGIFGNTEKTKRVIPNKVYDAMAMEKPVITADTKAIRELFTDGKDISLCNIADANDIALKILELKKDKEKMFRIAKNGHILFIEELSPKKLVENMLLEIGDIIV